MSASMFPKVCLAVFLFGIVVLAHCANAQTADKSKAAEEGSITQGLGQLPPGTAASGANAKTDTNSAVISGSARNTGSGSPPTGASGTNKNVAHDVKLDGVETTTKSQASSVHVSTVLPFMLMAFLARGRG